MRFELGPTLAPGGPYGAWVPRWFDFFTSKMQEIVTGDPRNVRGRGGIWPLVGGSQERSPEDEAEADEAELNEE